MSNQTKRYEFVVERIHTDRAKITVTMPADTPYDDVRERAEWVADNSTPEDQWQRHDEEINILREIKEGDDPCILN